MRESVQQADDSIRQTGPVKRRRDDLYLVDCCVTGRGRGGRGRVVRGRVGQVAGSVNVVREDGGGGGRVAIESGRGRGRAVVGRGRGRGRGSGRDVIGGGE